MHDLKDLMKTNYLNYASYVILERAIPNIDGLKPVQRRILHTLFNLDDGKFHKVSTVSGQTMGYHPHGEAAINDALINIGVKGFLMDTQGNFGNIFTGDPASAPRYIEARLSPLAKETLFNPNITEFIPSYDGRKQEPVLLPTKIPIVLMMGTEGIAVGMSTKIFPHNFNELLQAQIAYLENKPFSLLPDFPTGGILDPDNYQDGNGKVKLRAKLDILNDKTVVIREICYGTTTESLIQSIDDAAKKGKIKIDSIHDYTAEKVEIHIVLPRGQYAKKMIETLYAFTDCETTLSCQCLVIKDNFPWETNITELLKNYTDQLSTYIKQELGIELSRLSSKIYRKNLERIFIENKLYKKLESVKTAEGLHKTLQTALKAYRKQLTHVPTHEDLEFLLHIPIRKISKFDQSKNEDDIENLESQHKEAAKKLKNLKRTTIQYLKKLLKTFGEDFPRKTNLKAIEEIDKKAVSTKKIKVGINLETGYIGEKVKSSHNIECTNYDKLLLIYNNGTYQVINIPEKKYVHHKGTTLMYAGIADKQTVINVIYKDTKNNLAYAKRFIVKQFLLDKIYVYMDSNMKLMCLSSKEEPSAIVQFKPKAKQKVNKLNFNFSNIIIKNPKSKGTRVSSKPVKSIKLLI